MQGLFSAMFAFFCNSFAALLVVATRINFISVHYPMYDYLIMHIFACEWFSSFVHAAKHGK